MNEIIDIGVNLTHRSFDKDRDAVIQRAADAGVSAMILTGTSERASTAARKLALQHPGRLYSTAGVHPHDAKHATARTMSKLRDLAQHPEVVAIGECGLDFNRNFSPRQAQATCFRQQIELACELNMPLFLHERDAHEAFVDIVSGYRSQFEKAVVHCFTGTAEELDQYLVMDMHIGITGWICDERRGLHLRELLPRMPLERLMLETDAPFLLPRDLKPRPADRRNEPTYLPHILKVVAESLGKTEKEVAEATTKTARAFFGI